MKRTFLMTVAAAALIAGAGLASAQDKPQMPRAGAAPGAASQPPAEKSAAPMNQGAGAATQGAASSDTKMDKPATAETQDKSKLRSRSAQDNKSKAMDKNAQAPDAKTDTKAKADSKMSSDTKTKSSADSKTSTDSKISTDTKSSSDASQRSTTGQGAAAAKTSVNLSTEQRTKITSVIKQQNVKPLTNVNFSISIGTRVPRTVHFYTLPTTVVEVYPEWRGFSYMLVGDEIVIINPRTYEIVFILSA